MLIIDFFNVTISRIHQHCIEYDEAPELNLMRIIATKAVLGYVVQHKKYADNGVVIACDSKSNWRFRVFPLYKKNRKKKKEKSKFDYEMFYKNINILINEFRENLPFKVMEVEGAEADDIISVISRIFSNKTDVCIVSSDKDFIQLQHIARPFTIKQYSPYRGCFVTQNDIPITFAEHIIGGDADDGVPNIWSQKDVFLVDGIKQKSFTKVKKEELNAIGLTAYRKLQPPEIQERIDLNEQLIDLTKIPQDISDSIIHNFMNTKEARGKLNQYIVSNKMNTLLEHYGGIVF